MRVLFLGDVVGRSGRKAVLDNLPQLKLNLRPDFIIVNGENAAGGFGITPTICDELFNAGVVLNPALLEIFTDENALKSGGYTDAAISAAKSQDITSKDLIGLGFDVCDLNTFSDVKRTWDRFENPTLENVTSEYRDALQMRRKAEVLKYNQNAIQNPPKQQLTNILKGRPSICTRGVTFASNKQNSSNSNVNNLNRVNNTLIYPVQTNAPRSLPPGNSGVPGNKPLVLDKSIPLFQFQRRYTYSTS